MKKKMYKSKKHWVVAGVTAAGLLLAPGVLAEEAGAVTPSSSTAPVVTTPTVSVSEVKETTSVNASSSQPVSATASSSTTSAPVSSSQGSTESTSTSSSVSVSALSSTAVSTATATSESTTVRSVSPSLQQLASATTASAAAEGGTVIRSAASASPSPSPTASDLAKVDATDLRVRSHVQDIGWQSPVTSSQVIGTTGRGKRLEAVELSLTPDMSTLGDIIYQSHVQDIGWQSQVRSGSVSGTVGLGKRLEAVNMQLTRELAAHFDLYYRAHIQDYGWLGWTKNGSNAGTEGLSKRLEALEIQLLPKGSVFSGDMSRSFIKKGSQIASVLYRTYIENQGWQSEVKDGNLSGTTGRNQQIESLGIRLNSDYLGSIVYQSHVQNVGWITGVSNGTSSGQGGSHRQLEAVKVSLVGEISRYYDVYYRVHSQQKGWLGWTKNGLAAGTEGLSLGIEGIEVTLVKKGEKAPGTTANSFVKKTRLSPIAEAINGLGGYVPSDAVRLSLEKAIKVIKNQSYDVGFVLYDLATRKGVSYNANKGFYVASAIKAPYVASLAANNKSAFQSYQSTIKDILYYSSNDGYNLLRRIYGGVYMEKWMREAGVNPALAAPGYPYITANEMAKLWERNNLFFQNTATGKQMASWYERPNLSPIRSMLGSQYNTKSKAGWIGMPGYHAANDAGIVTTPKGRYVLAVMSNADGKLGLLNELVLSLNNVHKSL